MKRFIPLIFLVVMAALMAVFYLMPKQKNMAVFHSGSDRFLILEAERDDVLHFEFGSGKSTAHAIQVTPMVAQHSFGGARVFEVSSDGIETAALKVKVDGEKPCFSVTAKATNTTYASICADNPGENQKALTLDVPEMQNAYGLGEAFGEPGVTEGDWVGRVRDSGHDDNKNNRGPAFGNNMHGYNGGAVGNAQFPILYAVGAQNKNFALFLDNVYRQRWDFTNKTKWQAQIDGGELRGYIFAGPDLPSLRRDYMTLTGRPPVPPKKAFGLWVSEYGFDNWAELEGKLKSLRAANFPVDGFVLDLQWFGGIKEKTEDSPMGGLVWDRKAFPDPEKKIADLRNQGIGIIVIEESYVSKGVLDPETQKTVHEILESKGYLARSGPGQDAKAALIDYNPWWGIGGMIDWINDDAGKFIHDWRRQALINQGVMGHWTDLGEPEMFEPGAFYNNGQLRHADIHNIYNLKWSQSIYDGYQRNKVRQRPWILSRSGTSGSQRYGVGMWSGDIGSNLRNLSSHLNVQMHMSFSGVDYFGSDIGGFHRKALEGDLNEMYTQWFANGALLDVPVRVHTFNLENKNETAPDRIGHKESNLHNIRMRYELIPYYYSLAHQANRNGDPLVAPLVMHFQNDENVRRMGDEKMIGRGLLVATISKHGQNSRDVYLPAGTWYDYHSHKAVESKGEWLRSVPARVNGIFRLPVYARAGAILPKARLVSPGDLVLRVYPSTEETSFMLYEDDGATNDYVMGEVRRTRLSQQQNGNQVLVTVGKAEGNFEGANDSTAMWLELPLNGIKSPVIQINGQPLNRVNSLSELNGADSGFTEAGGLLVAKFKNLNRTQENTWKVSWP